MVIDITNGHYEFGWFVLSIISLLLYILLPQIIRLCIRYFGKKADDANEITCDYRSADALIGKSKVPVIAVVEVRGLILNDMKSVPRGAAAIGGITFGIDQGELLKKLSKNKALRGVMLLLDTPGGMVAGSVAIASGIETCRNAGKATIAYVKSMSASGGLMAMVPAEIIIADENATIGSLGVIGPTLMQYEGVQEITGTLWKSGVRARKITARTLYAGKGKNLGDPFSKPEKGVVEGYMEILDRTYERFVAHVARHRGIDPKKLREKGAAMMDAERAREFKLISAVGSYEQAKALMAIAIGGTKWSECAVVNIVPARQSNLASLLSSFVVNNVPGARASMMRTIFSHVPARLLLPEFDQEI